MLINPERDRVSAPTIVLPAGQIRPVYKSASILN